MRPIVLQEVRICHQLSFSTVRLLHGCFTVVIVIHSALSEFDISFDQIAELRSGMNIDHDMSVCAHIAECDKQWEVLVLQEAEP